MSSITGLEIFRRAPRDFVVLLIVHLVESFVIFNLFSVLMWVLTKNAGFSDSDAGWLYSCFGLSSAIFSVCFGPLIDKMLIRKTLMLSVVLNFIGLLIMSFTLHPVAVVVALFVPISFSIALGGTAVNIALLRYIPDSHQNLAFAAYYISMNIGEVLASISVDQFRLFLTPLEYTGYLLYRPVWSFFLFCSALLHIPAFVLIFFWIRDIQIKNLNINLDPTDVELSDTELLDASHRTWREIQSIQSIQKLQDAKQSSKQRKCCHIKRRGAPLITVPWEIEIIVPKQPQTFAELRTKVRGIVSNPMFKRFVMMSLSLVGARSIFVYVFTLYPLYMERAPFPVEDPKSVPFMTFLLIDPIIVILMTWVVSAVVNKLRLERFWVIFWGCCLGLAAPVFMMIPRYWAVIMFIVVMAVAESIWSPLYSRYTGEFTVKGEEGMFYGLVGITTLFSKTLTGAASGYLLRAFCPNREVCAQKGYLMWLFATLGVLTTPILLLVTCHWTWLKSYPKTISSFSSLSSSSISSNANEILPKNNDDLFEPLELLTKDNEQITDL